MHIGLISDTHMPDRLAALPATIIPALRGVDLILHAGDVGELWVLDELSQIAPVVAVHGNDDTPAAQRELPYQQIVAVAGTRILLSHAHYPDRTEELASRVDDAWGPKLARRAAMARPAGAGLMVFGHTHIPMACPVDGVLLVNPGAVAPPNDTSRQTLRSVARLIVDAAGVTVQHIDLDAPAEPLDATVDLAAGFAAAHRRVTASILTPELAAALPALRASDESLRSALRVALKRAAHRCWSGGLELVGPQDVLDELSMAQDDTILLRQALARLVAGGGVP